MSRIHLTVSRVALAAGTIAGAFALAAGLGVAQTVAQTGSVPLAPGAAPFGVAIDAAAGRMYVADSAHDTLSIIDLVSSAVIGIVPTGAGPGLVLFDPVMKRVYVSNFAGASLTVVDASPSLSIAASNPPLPGAPDRASAVVATLPVGGLGLALNPSTQRIYAASGGSLAVIDATTSAVLTRVAAPRGANLWGVAVDPIANRVYLTDLSAARLLVYDGATDTFTGELAIEQPGRLAIAVSADGSRVYAAGYTDVAATLSVVDARNRTVVAMVALGRLPFSIAIDEPRGLLFASNYGDGTVSVVGLASNRVESTKPAGLFPAGLAVSAGRLYVVSAGDQRVLVDP